MTTEATLKVVLTAAAKEWRTPIVEMTRRQKFGTKGSARSIAALRGYVLMAWTLGVRPKAIVDYIGRHAPWAYYVQETASPELQERAQRCLEQTVRPRLAAMDARRRLNSMNRVERRYDEFRKGLAA